MPFRIALSGLDAASTNLKVTGNNIANAATTGFKASRTEFADLYANSIQDSSTASSGQGVKVARVAQQFGQGNLEFTTNNLDLAINGQGFFVVEDGSGNPAYTRAGTFGIDRDGAVVDNLDRKLQVFPPIDNTGLNFNTGATTDLNLPTLSGAPAATERVTASLNLSSAQPTPTIPWINGPVDPTDAAYNPLTDPNLESNLSTDMYNHATSTTVYDSLGTAHRATLYYVNTATAGEWNAYAYIDGTLASFDPATPQHYASLTFDANGNLVPGAGDVDAQGRLSIAGWEDDAIPGAGNGSMSNGADSMVLEFDYANSTQYGSDFEVNDLTQDGYSSGRLSGIDIDNKGVVSARFTNGKSDVLGQLAMAKFNSVDNLRQTGDTSWSETHASGDVQLGASGTSSFGLIQSGALENSNVDLAAQLVNLIMAQRQFQANAQVITTADTTTQTIINLR
jgi:flagellar hook protein FlgE